MRKSILSLLFIVGFTMIIGSSGPLCAQSNPNISITLSFNKEYYEFGEPVGVTVVVSNTSGKDLLVSKGFSSLNYYLELRVIDPAGRVLLANRGEVQPEIPDAPPAPFVLDNFGVPLRTASCELLPAGWSRTSGTNDLRAFYPLKFPGKYSAQVELSAMIFKKSVGDQCSLNPKDTDISNTLKSSTSYIYMKGSTAIHVAPNQWKLGWLESAPPNSEIEVQIIPGNGMTVNDYGINPDNYFLNNVKATSVERRDLIVQAFFPLKDAILSLGPVTVGQWYDVVVLGTLVNSTEKIIGMFGGGDKIRVVND